MANPLREMSFGDLLGKTVKGIEVLRRDGSKTHQDELLFHCEEGLTMSMTHWQDCCEWVYIEDIVGDLSDLIGSQILQAEEVSEDNLERDGLWTFYKLATAKGYVTLRWYGESEFYSLSVSCSWRKTK